MSNLKHGFYSTNTSINPDSLMLGADNRLTGDDVLLAEQFLCGVSGVNVIEAHRIIKIIYQYGELKYPTLWYRAKKHVNGYEFDSLEKLSNLPDVRIK